MGNQYKAQFTVTGKSKNRKTGKPYEYTVSIRHDETWECSCPNWTQNHPREDCKHILAMKLKQTAGFVAPLVVDDKLSLEQATGRKFRG